jgi:tetratricopeptide (TPR) repeat protein
MGRLVLLGMLASLPLAGCGGENGESPPAQEGSGTSQALSDQAQLLVTQGNAAQREGRYADALEHFRQALEMHPNHPVPQFGTLLAAEALGDTNLVQSLREKLAVSGPELLQMLGPEGTMGGMGTPSAEHQPAGSLPSGENLPV